MGRRREATLQDTDVNFNSLIRGQIRREVRSELQTGFRDLFAKFAQLFREPRKKRVERLVEPLEGEERHRVRVATRCTYCRSEDHETRDCPGYKHRETKRSAGRRTTREASEIVQNFITQATKVLGGKCYKCRSTRGLHARLVHPHRTTPPVLAREFFTRLRGGVRAVRKHFLLVCGKCGHHRKTGLVVQQVSEWRGQILTALGRKCADCGNKPAGRSIVSPKGGIRDNTGVRTPFAKYTRGLAVMLKYKGVQWFRAQYDLRCRPCINTFNLKGRHVGEKRHEPRVSKQA